MLIVVLRTSRGLGDERPFQTDVGRRDKAHSAQSGLWKTGLNANGLLADELLVSEGESLGFVRLVPGFPRAMSYYLRRVT